jgi:hypothetical protein
MRYLTQKQRQDHKQRRKDTRIRTTASIRYVVRSLCESADQLIPGDTMGATRRDWVLAQCNQHLLLPDGKPVNPNVLDYLIELAVDEL